MQKQDTQLKLIQIGNSQGVIIPKKLMRDLHVTLGQTIPAERSKSGILLKIPTSSEDKSSVTPEFKKWLDTFVKKNETLIKELAKR